MDRPLPRTLASLAAALALCALGAAPARAQTPAEHPLLIFHGNVLLNDFLYRSLLDLPPGAKATRERARLVAGRLLSFLRRAGYDLATVRAAVAGDQIDLTIDEGQLDKIIFLGDGAFETLRLKLELTLPFNVFNRPLLERQLRDIATRHQMRDFAYELVPVETRNTPGPKLDEIEPLQGLSFWRPGSSYELRIFVAPSEWGVGLSPDLYIGSLEGLGIGLHYTNRGLIAEDDRWELRGRVATSLRSHLDVPDSRFVLTRTTEEARYYTPPVTSLGLRPSVGVRFDLLNRQRGDLRLEGFDQGTIEGSVDVRDVVLPQLQLGVGLGVERRFLFAIQEAPGGANTLVANTPKAQNRPYAQASFQLTFNPNEIRRDRKHELDLFVRRYAAAAEDRPSSLRLFTEYQKMFAIGFHELWLTGRGTLLAGDVLFADEDSVGSHLRGPFGASDFIRKAVSAGVEFRYSIIRDEFKIGLYHDAVLYGVIDRATNGESARGANALGLGLHALIIDEFQLDFYLGGGLSTDGRSDRGMALQIHQAF